MLKDMEVMAVLPAKDMDRAREFYRDKLGFEPERTMADGGLVYR